jgi:hypothetical protein
MWAHQPIEAATVDEWNCDVTSTTVAALSLGTGHAGVVIAVPKRPEEKKKESSQW